MSPYRVRSRGRVIILDDVYVEILKYLDPTSLVSACMVSIFYNIIKLSRIDKHLQAFRRVWKLVKDYPPLRYTYNLVVSGLVDVYNTVPRAVVPPYARLQLLEDFLHDWRTLVWAHEMPSALPASHMLLPNGQSVSALRVGVAGGVLHYIVPAAGQHSYTLDISGLPSGRTNCPPSRTPHLRFDVSPIDDVTIDQQQGLIIATRLSR